MGGISEPFSKGETETFCAELPRNNADAHLWRSMARVSQMTSALRSLRSQSSRGDLECRRPILLTYYPPRSPISQLSTNWRPHIHAPPAVQCVDQHCPRPGTSQESLAQHSPAFPAERPAPDVSMYLRPRIHVVSAADAECLGASTCRQSADGAPRPSSLLPSRTLLPPPSPRCWFDPEFDYLDSGPRHPSRRIGVYHEKPVSAHEPTQLPLLPG